MALIGENKGPKKRFLKKLAPGGPRGSFFAPFGRPLGAFGCSLGTLGHPMGSIWALWGAIWGAFGLFGIVFGRPESKEGHLDSLLVPAAVQAGYLHCV